MKAIFVSFNQAYYEMILNVMDRNNIRGFTYWNEVQGRGSKTGEPHYGSHAWPTLNSAILAMVDDETISWRYFIRWIRRRKRKDYVLLSGTSKKQFNNIMNDLFNILIFSKDYNQGVVIQDYIKAIGYNSQVFDQEEAAYEGFLSRNFTLCIINHDIDTKETRTLAAMIKSSENIIPVVFLCEHPTREEIALLFSFHADDVIRKPLDTDILQARIKAVQSRYQPQRKKEVRTYIFGKFKFDLQKQILSIEGKTTKLTTKEADLLTLLCQHANNMVDRMHALQIIWRSDNYFSARSMDVYITKLRKLLQDDPTIKIINVHGKGYKLSTRENDN